MKITINFSQFVDAFHKHGRYDSFGDEALKIIFEYIETVEDDKGEDIELDVISICCNYNINTYDIIAKDYGIDISETEDEEDNEEMVIDYLKNNNIYLGKCNDGIVYQSF